MHGYCRGYALIKLSLPTRVDVYKMTNVIDFNFTPEENDFFANIIRLSDPVKTIEIKKLSPELRSKYNRWTKIAIKNLLGLFNKLKDENKI